MMFTKEIVGTANGIVGGWGNVGAAVGSPCYIVQQRRFVSECANSCMVSPFPLSIGYESFGWNDIVSVVPNLFR
jgi:nitrate/nitrite transporter NarK